MLKRLSECEEELFVFLRYGIVKSKYSALVPGNPETQSF
jgi:hypothetical protein